MVSEKQKALLLKNGYSEETINAMDYNVVSKLIGDLLKPKNAQANQAPYNKVIPSQEVITTEKVGEWKAKKSGFDSSSAFTRQTTDLVIKSLDLQAQYILAKVITLEQASDIGTLTSQAIQCVKAMKKEFE